MRGYRGQTHRDPDTSDLVWKVAKNVEEYDLLSIIKDRERHPNSSAKATIDILLEGEKKLWSSSIKTFNDKVRASLRGRLVSDDGTSVCEEQDDIPPMALGSITDDTE